MNNFRGLLLYIVYTIHKQDAARPKKNTKNDSHRYRYRNVVGLLADSDTQPPGETIFGCLTKFIAHAVVGGLCY